MAASAHGKPLVCNFIVSTLGAVLLVFGNAGMAADVDPASGLVIDEHWQLVLAHCSACHSPRLVTQNRGSRQTWLDMIRWMQDTQGLWQFDAATEKSLLDYLEKNYAPGAVYRRAPLPRSLMPAGAAVAGP